MAKIIHVMVRVLEETRSVNFYQSAFNLEISQRLDFDDFTLVYLRNADTDMEVELTINKTRTEKYDLGDGYGHIAFCVDNLDKAHQELIAKGHKPNDIKEFSDDGTLLARFFFIQDPDGYKIEVLQRHGHYQ